MSVDCMHVVDGSIPTESVDCIVLDPAIAIAMVTRVRNSERERREAEASCYKKKIRCFDLFDRFINLENL